MNTDNSFIHRHIDDKEIESDDNFECIVAKDIGMPGFERMAFAYDIVEFNTALKPFFINYLFDFHYQETEFQLSHQVQRPLMNFHYPGTALMYGFFLVYQVLH